MICVFKENIKIIKDYFKLVEGSKLWIFFLFLSSILGHISSLLIPVFAANIISELGELNTFKTYYNIFLLGMTYISYNLFWYINYCSYTNNFIYSYKKLRERIIDKFFTYDLEYTNKISKGRIINTVNTDVAHLSEMIDQICEMIVVLVKLIVIALIFIKTNIILGILVLLLDILYLKLFDYCNVKCAYHTTRRNFYKDKLTDNLTQILNGLSEIKMFNIYKKIKGNFFILAAKWSNEYSARRKYANIRETLLPFIIHFGKIALYIIMCALVLAGKYEVNILILLISYFESLMDNSTDLMDYSSEIREWSISISRINKILNYSSSQNIQFGENKDDNIVGLVEFKNVSFSYKANNKGNIKNISFTAKPNEITAIVGHSGSGKTTIINLLLRKYKLDKGTILIDRDSIYDYTDNAYSTNVIGVNQIPYMFNMSIKQNLNLIDSNHERQIEVCKRVGIHDYIMSLPKGYNTKLTENAQNFSGGQKQLLAIARTLLSKAEVLIFDEVTSSLDPVLVEKIKDIFENLKIDHTIIIITHKKDVMKIADKIVVLDKGKIVGVGTHDELLEYNNYYIDLQANKYVIKEQKK